MRAKLSFLHVLVISAVAVVASSCHRSEPCRCTQQTGCHCPLPPLRSKAAPAIPAAQRQNEIASAMRPAGRHGRHLIATHVQHPESPNERTAADDQRHLAFPEQEPATRTSLPSSVSFGHSGSSHTDAGAGAYREEYGPPERHAFAQ